MRYYSRIKEIRPNEIQLQGVGWVKAVKAETVKIGESFIWNYGETSTVTAILDKTDKFITFEVRSNDEYTNGQLYTLRMKKDRLVATVEVNHAQKS